LEKVN